MKTYTRERYGGPELLSLSEVPEPTPKDHEILVEVHASSLNMADWYALLGSPWLSRLSTGLFKPSPPTLGRDFAGIVKALGSKVQNLSVGDEVFGEASTGAYGEQLCVNHEMVTLKPKNLSFTEAACIPLAGLTAYRGIVELAEIQPGMNVLINGASGSVGTFALQMAVMLGSEVTAVCSSRHVAQCQELGATHVIDYTQTDFAAQGGIYDAIVGINGYRSLSDYKRSLKQGGVYVMVGGKMKQIFGALLLGGIKFMRSGKKIKTLTQIKNRADSLKSLRNLCEEGKIKPVVEKVYSFEEVTQALHDFGEGHTSGKRAIAIRENG